MEFKSIVVLEALVLILMATMLIVARDRWVQLTVAAFLLIGAGVCGAMLMSKESANSVLTWSGVCTMCRK